MHIMHAVDLDLLVPARLGVLEYCTLRDARPSPLLAYHELPIQLQLQLVTFKLQTKRMENWNWNWSALN